MNENVIKLDMDLGTCKMDLDSFKLLTDKSRGDIVECLCKRYFKHFNMSFEKLNNKGFQKLYGDFMVLNRNKDVKFLECKTSHQWKGIDKVALDYAYYRRLNGKEFEYIQKGSTDNLGYIHYLKADILFCYNPHSNRIYFVHEFQKVKNNILNLLERYNYEWDIIGYSSHIEPSIKWDYNIKGKYSRILNLELSNRSIESFGGKLMTYELNNDIINLDIKKALNVGSTQDFS